MNKSNYRDSSFIKGNSKRKVSFQSLRNKTTYYNLYNASTMQSHNKNTLDKKQKVNGERPTRKTAPAK